jgi:hypothetical protein
MITHPTARSLLEYSVRESLGAAKQGARSKSLKFEAFSRAQGATFVPFVVETFGGFCKEAVSFISTLATFSGLHSQVWTAEEIYNPAVENSG